MADASPPVDPQAAAAATPAASAATPSATSAAPTAEPAAGPLAADVTAPASPAPPPKDETVSEMAADEAQALLDSINASDTSEAAASGSAAPAGAVSAAESDEAAMEELLKQGNFEDPAAPPPAADAEPFQLPSFQQVMQDAQVSSIDLLRDVELNVKIELGRNRMLVEDVLKLGEGSVVELDKLAGDPVDVFVNDRLVARGEVLVLNDNFCVRVNEIVAGAKEEGL